jgi:hypothetical protein
VKVEQASVLLTLMTSPGSAPQTVTGLHGKWQTSLSDHLLARASGCCDVRCEYLQCSRIELLARLPSQEKISRVGV